MPDWLSHLLMLAAGVPVGGFTNFLLTRKRQTSDEWQAIVARQGERITALEAKEELLQRRIEALMAENAVYQANAARLQAEIDMLKARKDG